MINPPVLLGQPGALHSDSDTSFAFSGAGSVNYPGTVFSGGPFSGELFFKTTVSDQQPLIQMGPPGNFAVYVGANNFTVWVSGTPNTFTPSSTPTSGGWQELGVGYDGTNLTFWQNAQVLGSTVVGPITLNPNGLVVGATFDGLIDEFSLFDRGLTQRERDDLFFAAAH
jgi:hypothetical protein